jgi:anti-anti-sigma regulatory factor
MTTVVEWHKVSGDSVAQSLQRARENLNGAEGEVLLDFEAVRRIDPSGLRAAEALADTADQKSVKVTLRGVNVAVYKVLKLARLSPRFVFVS